METQYVHVVSIRISVPKFTIEHFVITETLFITSFHHLRYWRSFLSYPFTINFNHHFILWHWNCRYQSTWPEDKFLKTSSICLQRFCALQSLRCLDPLSRTPLLPDRRCSTKKRKKLTPRQKIFLPRWKTSTPKMKSKTKNWPKKIWISSVSIFKNLPLIFNHKIIKQSILSRPLW